MLAPALADARCRVGSGAVAPGEEQGCTFHREETLADAGGEEKRRGEKESA